MRHGWISRRGLLVGAAALGAAALTGGPRSALGAARAATGRWGDPQTWPDGRLPSAAEPVLVTGSTVIDQDVTVDGLVVESGAELVFAPDRSATLQSTGNVVIHGRLVMHPASEEVLHRIQFADVDEERFVGGDAGRSVAVSRIWGADRYATAVEISRAAFPGGAQRVYLATGEDFPDALAAAPVAGGDAAPILLTRKDALPDVTRDEVVRLSPSEVVILGGARAVDPGVETEVARLVPTRRIAGEDRYGTAAAVAAESGTRQGGTMLLATGQNFPDALAAGVTAARLGAPLLLTAPDVLPSPTEVAVVDGRPDRVLVLGGPLAVADAVLDRLRALGVPTVERVAGEDRYVTAVRASELVFPATAPVVYLATGEAFPDALAGAPLALRDDGPVLLCRPTSLPDVVATALRRLEPQKVVVLGGATAVDQRVLDEVAALLPSVPEGNGVLESDVGLWVVGGGQLDLVGTRRVGWNRTGSDPTWHPDDEIVVAPVAPGDSTGFRSFEPGGSVPQGPSGARAEVFDLTRNVVIEGTPAGRAHVLVRTTRPQTLQWALLRHLGPRRFAAGRETDQTGRYALHLHNSGDGTRGSVVEGVVVRDAGNHAFVAHASHGVTFTDCVAYDVLEDAYWWDPPVERTDPGNNSDDIVYRHCLAARVRVSEDADPQGRFELTGFYLASGRGTVAEDCAAVGVAGSVNASGFHWPSTVNGLEANVWEFRDCVAHNNAAHGVFVWQNTGTGPHLIDRLHSYRNGGDGVNHGAYTNVYHYRDGLLEENGRRAFTQHAQVPPSARTDDRPTCRDVTFRGSVGVALVTHNVAGRDESAFVYVGCDFREADVPVVVDDGANRSGSYDFVRCGLEPSDFQVVSMHPDSLLRVQRADGTAYRLESDGTATPIPAFSEESS